MNIKPKKIATLLSAVLFTFISMNICASPEKVKGTRGYIDERNKPIAPYSGPTRNGQQVYNEACATCHNRTTQGAPLPDDDVEWGYRIKKGKDVLIRHVMEGYKELMPVKGGCRNCSEEEVLAAIDFILQSSGIETPPGKK